MIGCLFAYFGWNALICPKKYCFYFMLGIDSKELPVVKGRYATNARKPVKRAHTGQLNASDKKTMTRSAKILEEFVVVKE